MREVVEWIFEYGKCLFGNVRKREKCYKNLTFFQMIYIIVGSDECMRVVFFLKIA